MNIKKRILYELFVTIPTVVPVALGGTLLLLSEVLGGMSAFVGFFGLVVGFGAFLTNLVFNLESISKRALKACLKEKQRLRENELDNLDRRLKKTEGSNDELALRNLRILYKSFNSDLTNGSLSENIPPQMLQSVDDIFSTCIMKLERSYEIYRTSNSMNGKVKRDLENQRQNVISEVESSIVELSNVINEVRTLKFRNESDQLRQLQAKLSSQLEVAKATEDGMASILNGGKSIDDRLREYE